MEESCEIAGAVGETIVVTVYVVSKRQILIFLTVIYIDYKLTLTSIYSFRTCSVSNLIT